MEGDVIIVEEHHRRAAKEIVERLGTAVSRSEQIYTITVAGESGSGKSETAKALQEAFAAVDVSAAILQQDDYFALPPKANDRHRRADLEWVGPQEVKIELLESHLRLARRGASRLVKPLVIYDEDAITTEVLSLEDTKVLIVEGTYTTLLEHVSTRIFIDRTREDTLETRRKRGREEIEPFVEKVLEIEHEIISSHRSRAQIVIARDYSVSFPANN